MASATLSAPGTEYGPCALGPNGEYLCEHSDCAVSYGMANTRCEHCGERIGWDTGFFNVTRDSSLAGEGDHSQRLVHSLCQYEVIEAATEDAMR